MQQVSAAGQPLEIGVVCGGYPQNYMNTTGISETNVLNVACARDDNDERHLCPLQLGVIERCVKLWSAPGDLVYSPFMGIGSEGYTALRLGRKFMGTELKPSYFNVAIRNLNDGVRRRDSGDDMLPGIVEDDAEEMAMVE
jgi:DNA modification methylase